MSGTTIQLKSGATQSDIQAAINNAKDGTTIVLPKNAYVKISGALKIDASDRDLTIDLNGSTLKQAGNDSVLEASGQHAWTKGVSLGTSNGNTTVKFSSTPSDLRVGDWIKVVSDDSLPGSSSVNVRMGEAMKVAAINGSTVTLAGKLHNGSQYDTNVRAAKYESGDLIIRNGTVQGDQTQTSWKQSLVWLDTLIGAKIDNLTVRDNNSMGITISDSIHAQVTDSVVKNLKDNTANANYGYGVLSKSSLGTVVDGLYAEKVRHATDSANSSVPANYSDAGRYGADIGMSVKNSVAYDTTAGAYSWHSEANYASLQNVQAFNSEKFAVLRGLNGTVSDSVAVNTGAGLQLYEYGDNDARNHTIDNVTLREVGRLGLFQSGSPANIRVEDSRFEAYQSPNALSSGTATISNTVFKTVSGDTDQMTGTAGTDRLFGGKGNDKISGAGGSDLLWGGAGADALAGGAGTDRFIFHNASEGGDIISDFQAGSGGDVLDVGLLLTRLGYRDTEAFSDGYLRVVQSGADTLVQLDSNGGGNSFGTTLAKLSNVDAAKLTKANFDLFFGSDGSADEVAVLGAATDPYGSA